MKNLLLSAAVGDIAGSPYEFHPDKNYDDVRLLRQDPKFTDDTVCTFACAEAIVNCLDMTETLRKRSKEHLDAGYGLRYQEWLIAKTPLPYGSFGNGSAMRCSAAGWLAKSEEECIRIATETALPTHNHPEGIKGAVATALAIYYLKEGEDKNFVYRNVLAKYYPQWAVKTYKDFHADYSFDETCQITVGPAIICFLESSDYVDCLKLAIALGGDADTLAAIASPMAYAYYREMPTELVDQALALIPEWMKKVNEDFDSKCEINGQCVLEEFDLEKAICAVDRKNKAVRPKYTPERITELNPNEIFVFGSNLAGRHGGGAARIAYKEFGAIMGQGIGLQGQSYAIPTMQGGTETIKPYVDEFIEFAKLHKELTFLVTRIGCGIAGFHDENIAPLFADAVAEDNIVLPKSFCDILLRAASQR